MMLRAVQRTFEVLDALAEANADGLRLHELGRVIGLSDPTLLRFLNSLGELGLVRPDARGRYHLTDRFRRYAGPELQDIRAAAAPILAELNQRLAEDVHLATLDADSVVCIETLKSSHLLRVAFGTGFRAPVYASAMGKVLLAFVDDEQRAELLGRIQLQPLTSRTIVDRNVLELDLERSRQRGFAVDDQELELGINCIAAPIFGQSQRVVASLSVTAPTHRKPVRELIAHAPIVLDAAHRISQRLEPGIGEAVGGPAEDTRL